MPVEGNCCTVQLDATPELAGSTDTTGKAVRCAQELAARVPGEFHGDRGHGADRDRVAHARAELERPEELQRHVE